MIAAVELTDAAEPQCSEQPRKRRRPDHTIEIRLVIDLQLPRRRRRGKTVQRSFWSNTDASSDSQLVVSDTLQQVPRSGDRQRSNDSYSRSMTRADLGGLTPSRSPSVVAVEAPALRPRSDAELSLSELYEKHLAPGERLKNEAKTVRHDQKRIAAFSAWLTEQRITTPRLGGCADGQSSAAATLADIAARPMVLHEYSRHLRSRSKGGSTATATHSLNAIMKLCRWAVDARLLSRLPKCPTRGDLNLMKPAFSQATDSAPLEIVNDVDFSGEPVSVAEMKRLMDPDNLAPCVWPCLGDVPPNVFWETVLLSHAILGFRSQDWFALDGPEKQGLLWSGIVDNPRCPKIEDLQNGPGWAWYLVHKTKKKSQRADKPLQILVPLCVRLRALIEQFRGIHPTRVFPLPHTRVSYSRELRGILQRAGLDDQSRLAARKPIVRLSEGKRAIASFRKGCAAMWADHVSESAASYLLKHSVSSEKVDVSSTTREHYLQAYRPLKAIVPALESLPVLQ